MSDDKPLNVYVPKGEAGNPDANEPMRRDFLAGYDYRESLLANPVPRDAISKLHAFMPADDFQQDAKVDLDALAEVLTFLSTAFPKR